MTDTEARLRSQLAAVVQCEPAPSGLAERLIDHARSAPAVRGHQSRRWAIALACAAVVVIAVGVGAVGRADRSGRASTGGQAVFASIPPTASSPHPAGICPIEELSSSNETDAGPVTVDPSPVAVTAVWHSGLNAKPCQAISSQGDAHVARQLAAEIRAARVVGRGTYNCPMDDGASVGLYFTFAGRSKAELVQLKLAGCAWLSAPGRASRRLTDSAHALATLAPPAFAQYMNRFS